jgi:hypothetical protein
MALLSKIGKTAAKMFVVPVLYLHPLKRFNRTPYEKTKAPPTKTNPLLESLMESREALGIQQSRSRKMHG